MKKLVALLIFALFFSLSTFSEERFYNDRIIDFTLDVPVNVSNNLIGTKDIFQDVVLIDFTKIADEMSDDGFSLIASTKPQVSFGLDIPNGLLFKINAGLDLYSNIGIGKSLFDFLGYGNTINEDITIDVKGFADLFLFAGLDVGWSTKKFSLVISPTVYSALAHVAMEDSKVVLSNSAHGEFSYDLKGTMAFYSDYFTPDFKNIDYKTLYLLDYKKIIENSGLDVGVSFSYDLYRYLTIYGNARIPIYPTKISTCIPTTITSSMSAEIMDIGNPQFTWDITKGDAEEKEIKINRPLKFFVSGKFHPFNGVMDYYGGLGFGIEHPFAGEGLESDFYFDYLLGMRLGFWHALNFYVSTERTDKIFSHKLIVDVNIRLLEVKVGVSAESSSFTGSFRGGGAGAFVQLSVGF
jgi:hypothetical protein